ncbi:FhaB protein [Canicola haemoglobinophilus]|uniref:FhaB protein n=2 Tax=Canicola haemoglobinophilus TaxID=733 RepID=A0AB38HB33_9PAST|nr:FhaB protein [Canicola haemoglobinophilus]STO69331.1 FhaB protein [Canicola haemoglobinophilus]
MNVGNNLTIESRQDSNQYDSKQTQVNAGASVTLNGSGSASFNASRNKAKLNYAQVEEQSGLSAGEGGLAINVGNHTHLKGGLIESKAEESKNRLHTKTFSTEDIKNHSEVKVESHSVGLSTNMAQNAMSAVATTIGALGNKNESQQSLTQSVVGNNIHFTAESQDEKTQQNLTALLRDTENANQKVQAYDLAEIREQQEMAQVIGEIAQNSINLTLKPKLEEAEKQKAEAEAILANKETNANQRIQAQRQLDNANQTIQTYGQGGDMQMAIRAVTGLLQGIATKNTGAAAVGLISPYANQFIKAQTGDNTTANLMAHALLGAIEAKATGTNALAGAAGALTGEAAAQIIAQKLYGIDGKSKTTNDLSESEKQTITALSQLAGGLAGGIIGDSTTSAVSSADIAKRAVENNFLSEASRIRLNELRNKYLKGEKLTVKEEKEFLVLVQSDHQSDGLLDKFRQDPNSLTTLERQQFLMYVERYLQESISGKTLSGYKFAKPINMLDAKKAFEFSYLNGNPTLNRDYTFPYAGTNWQKNNAVDNLSPEYKTLGFRTEKHSIEEEMYHSISRKYNALSTYYNSFNGRVALSTKDALEYGLSLYGGQNILKGIQAVTNITSNSTKFTLGIAGASSVGSQMISTGSVDPKTLGIDLATAYALKGRGFTANVLGNTASGAFNGYVTDQSVVNGAIGSGVGSLIGYGTGKIVELPLNKKFNPDPTWLKYNPQPLSNEIPFIYSYKKDILHGVLGNGVGELGNRIYQYQREKYNNGEKNEK